VAGVTPPGAFRKMNSEVYVCSTLTSNIIIMNMISILLDMYRLMQVHVRRAIHEVIPTTILVSPDSPVQDRVMDKHVSSDAFSVS